MLAITGCGTRDLIYTRDPEESRLAIETARGQLSTHSFDFGIEPDKEWELFNYFYRLEGSTTSPDTGTSASV